MTEQSSYTLQDYITELSKKYEAQDPQSLPDQENYLDELYQYFTPLLQNGRELKNVFEDIVTVMIANFSGLAMQEEFQETLSHYGEAEREHVTQIHLSIIKIMISQRLDILGRFFSCYLKKEQDSGGELEMFRAVMMEPINDKRLHQKRSVLIDRACKTGAILLAKSWENPSCFFVGVEGNPLFAKIAVFNLAFWKQEGIIICGDLETGEQHKIYELGLKENSIIRELDPKAKNYLSLLQTQENSPTQASDFPLPDFPISSDILPQEISQVSEPEQIAF